MRPPTIILAIGTTVVLQSGTSRAFADMGWDEASSPLLPNVRLADAVHRTELPGSLTLCVTEAKQCPPLRTLTRGHFARAPIWTNAPELGMDVAWGPLRLGLEMSIGFGDGPSTVIDGQRGDVGAGQRIPSGWLRSGGNVFVGTRFRGDRWRGYVELLGGFTTLSNTTEGAGYNGKDLDVIASSYTLGGRAGFGVILTDWLTAGAFVSGGGGEGNMTDLSAGLRFELRADAGAAARWRARRDAPVGTAQDARR